MLRQAQHERILLNVPASAQFVLSPSKDSEECFRALLGHFGKPFIHFLLEGEQLDDPRALQHVFYATLLS
jgi:hypothetical protein